MLPKQLNIADGGASYDRRGNLVTRTFGGSQAYWTWTYDHENQLTRVQTDDYYTPEASRWKVEFTYDGQGRLRIKKDYVWYSGYGWYPTGETRYLYDGLLLVQERSSANTPTVTYTRGRDLSGNLAGAGGIGGLLARSHGYSGGNWSSHNAYHADGNGNVTALANSAGALQASYRYDPYGRYLAGGGTLAGANVLRFSSKPWVGFAGSATSGLYYYGFRFYDPYLQRWVNRDPLGELGFEALDRLRFDEIGNGSNLYSFLKNASINTTDPWGLTDDESLSDWAKAIINLIKSIKKIYDNMPGNPQGCINPCTAATSLRAYCDCILGAMQNMKKDPQGSLTDMVNCVCMASSDPDCYRKWHERIEKILNPPAKK
jgi:RHS repeat-associated protein